MEKGKLVIKTGKSGLYANIQTDKGQLLTSLGGYIPNKAHESLNGKDIEFERTNGVVTKIICDSNTIFDKATQVVTPSKNTSNQNQYYGGQRQHYTSNQQRQTHSNTSTGSASKNVANKARAPYNFIPLNETIVPVDEILEDRSVFHSNRKTGYIELNITNKTPIYIRDTFSMDDLKEQKEKENKKERYINSDFFSPTGKPAIPGSSLRGMIRTMVEILSYSKFGFTQNDRRLYFRTFADSVKGVKDEYKRYMFSEIGQEKKMKAGILHKKSYQTYELIPAGKVTKVFREEAKRLRERGTEIERGIYKISDDEFVVSIINLQRKLNDYHIKKEHGQKQISLDYDTDIMDYVEDITRSPSVPNLVKLLNQKEKESKKNIDFVPCFYTSYTHKNKTQYAFGHNPYFRLPYFKTINDHINQNDKGEMDFANSIFGFVDSEHSENKTQIAGRVFFMDAVLEKDEIEKIETAPKILSSPKPTTFQHYLEQGNNSSDNERKHYNSETNIRGNKLYWNFKPNDTWKEKDQEKTIREIRSGLNKQNTIIKTAKSNSEFKGKIYFENLTEKELGALLNAIDLIPNSNHKIGMGKSYGLGSIQIQSSVFVSNPKERYTSLDAEWTTEWKSLTEQEKSSVKDSFSNYLLSKLPSNEKSTATKIWDLPRIKELVKMLQFYENESMVQKFTYMEMQKKEYKGRPILPRPTEI